MAVIKLQLKTDIRRLTVDKLPNYEELTGLAKGLFGSAFPSQFVIKYKDEEGDVISVTTDRELTEAFTVMKNQIARFTIEEVTAPKTSNDPNTIELDIDLGSNLGETIHNLIQSFQGAYSRRGGCNPNSNTPRSPGQQVHYGVTCDSCSAFPIIGNRYKCSVCPDYDLCESCHSQEKHKEHTLNKVERTGCPWTRGNHAQMHRAICDNCSQRIVGIRYKCNTCADYDLCEKCEKLKVHDPVHNFTQITHPVCPRRFRAPEPKTEEKPVTDDKPEAKAEEKVEVKPEEKPVEVKPIELRPVEVKPVVQVKEEKPVEVKPIEIKPVEVKPVEIVKEEKPVEIKPVAVAHPFADKIEQLNAMGFVDVDRNIALLVKHKGDLVKAVSDLL